MSAAWLCLERPEAFHFSITITTMRVKEPVQFKAYPGLPPPLHPFAAIRHWPA